MKVGKLIELLGTLDAEAEIKIACAGVSLTSVFDSGAKVDAMDIASVYAGEAGTAWIDGEP